MGLKIERLGDVAVVSPSGMLKGGKETDALETALRGLMADKHKKIVLDLRGVTHMSSTAIGVLASIHAGASNRGLAFHVCEVQDRIENVLTIIKLVRVLNLFDTRAEAINAFDKP